MRHSETRINEKRDDDLRELDARRCDEVELRTESSAHRRSMRSGLIQLGGVGKERGSSTRPSGNHLRSVVNGEALSFSKFHLPELRKFERGYQRLRPVLDQEIPVVAFK